jgi:hypothetical protein
MAHICLKTCNLMSFLSLIDLFISESQTWVSFAELYELKQEIFCEAEQTLFASFSGKRIILLNVEICWGHAPRPPGSALPNYGLQEILCEAEQTLFASFSGKRRILLNVEVCWGHAPRPPWSASPSFGLQEIFCEAEQTLFASFSGKRRILSNQFLAWDRPEELRISK